MNISRRRASSSSPHVVPTIRAISTAMNRGGGGACRGEDMMVIRKYLVAHDTPLYNVARERLLTEIKAVERATGARLGKTCGMNGDDDDATPAGFGVGHASYKAAFPNAPRPGGGK